MKSLRVRRAVNVLVTVLCGAMVLAAIIPLGSLLWLVVSRGAPGLTATFFTSPPQLRFSQMPSKYT